MSLFHRLPWRTVENLGYLRTSDRCNIRVIHELFFECPGEEDIEGTVVGIVTSYRYNYSNGQARVTLLDETGLINALIDSDIILYGGLIGYVRIGAVIVAKTTTLFTLSTSPNVGSLYITKECIVAIISKEGEVVPGILFNYSDDDNNDEDDDDGDDNDDDVV